MQNENLNMYKLSYEPEKLDDFNDYFIQYLKTKESRYFNELLHFYEPVLNRKADRIDCRRMFEIFRIATNVGLFKSSHKF